MAESSHHGGTSFSRLFGLLLGLAFLFYNIVSFREHYLLSHHGTPINGTVTDVKVVRRKGGINYNVEYKYSVAGKEYLGKGQTDQTHFLALQPGHPISLLYVPSSPDIAEVEGAGNENVGLFVNGFIGIPIGLFVLGINLRRPKAPPKDDDDFIGNDTEGRSIEMPNAVEGIAFTMYPVSDMKRARAFYEGDLGLRPAVDLRGEWVEYHVWDNCFALTKMTDSVKPNAQTGGSIAFEVNDVDSFVGRLRKKGVAIKVEPFATRVCRMAVVLDPEGNALTLHQRLKA